LKVFDPGHRAQRLGTALFLLLLAVLPVPARAKSEAWANTQFSVAEHLRETLNNLPAAERTRHEYQRVISAYRRVYYGAPTSGKADPSAFAVAQLLAEMGRSLDSESALHAAIGQYKFLRREYPGSRDRFEALFDIAQIYQDDLKDPAQAKPVFEEFLRRYPRNHRADAARAALTQPVQKAVSRTKVADQDIENDSRENQDDKAADASNTAKSDTGDRTAKSSRITNIRHWSGQNYTRVAIDLEQDAKFESRRIENPERIFFDLQDTNLVSNLLGKNFDVNDGLLNKIRVAQFQPGKARIVLEVADHSDYDTFLLTNPARLIVDIHSKDIHSKDVQSKDIRGKGIEGKDALPPENSDSVNASTQKRPMQAQPIQPASLKQPEPLNPSRSRVAESPAEDSTSAGTRPPVILPGKAKAPPTQASGSVPKKIIVDADDSNDEDDGVTVTKLDPPEIKPPSRTARTLVPPPAKGSARNQRKATESFPDVREASPTASGDRSLIRALGLKIGRIVIDPGHGGHDTGTIGPNGLEEKDLVLDVGRRLGKLLQARLGADVVYTRKDDTFIPLETRTSIANQEQADLFVSIHANSSRDPDARGVETYYLNFTSSAEALDVAARENAASDKSVYELQDLVKKIALKEKIEESREFATNVQRALHSGLAAKSPGIRDRGVKKAPFIVLIGANMPSILAEISFVSNPGDERKLQTPDYRQRIAESLYRGISKYVSGLSGVKVASKIEKGEGQ
jgi:N-acetylmuramoyl-L-alanine amidase